ncbi:MAG: CpaF family protein [Acidimicrobiia bacterium]
MLPGLRQLPPALAEALDDSAVSEIMLNGPGVAFVERRGVLERLELELDARDLRRIVEQTLSPLGLSLDRLHPIVDARLADGSRFHAVAEPLAIPGPVVTVRRFRPRRVELHEFGMDSRRIAQVGLLVRDRANVLITGPTNSGKTTLLDAIVREFPASERVVVIEDTLELRCDRDHVVRLEARPANGEGVGGVTMRDLVRAALRMRPDRLVIGEVRSGEAFDLLQALNTGHRGCVATVHANSPADALVRLETLALLAGVGVDAAVVRRQIAAGLDAIVHAHRRADGNRLVTEIAKVVAEPMLGVESLRRVS